jgi:hypothetical protein
MIGDPECDLFGTVSQRGKSDNRDELILFHLSVLVEG